MCANTRMDKIRNEVIRVRLRVVSISAKLLRWFYHVQRKASDKPVRRVKSITIDGKRSRGKLKKT